MSVSDLELLRNILDEINFVLDHTSGKSKDSVLNDPVLFRAIIRRIEIVGEASKKLSPAFTAQYSEIEWKKMGRTRDILIHVYFDIDNEIVWNIITDKLPPLRTFINTIVRQQ